MRSGTQRYGHPTPPLATILLCALLALLIGYCGSYLLTHMGVGVATTDGKLESSSAIFSKSALNYYVMHGVKIIGSGRVHSELGGIEKVSASIKLPLAIWAFVPMLALMAAGYVAGKGRAVAGRWATIIPVILGGVLYAVILGFFSRFVHSYVNTSTLPEINGTSFNPPQIPFYPSAIDAFLKALIYGVIFTYLGALISIRQMTRTETAGKWWACAKAAVLMALIVQILIAATVGVLFFRKAEPGSGAKFTQALPSIAILGYITANGSTANAGIESKLPGTTFGGRPFAYRANLYDGITRNDDQEKSHKQFPRTAYILTALLGLSFIIAGWMAVRWGSRDGSIPTAIRIVIFHMLNVAILMQACEVVWSSITRSGSMVSELNVYIRNEFAMPVAYVFVGAFVLASIGAYFASLGRHRIYGN